MKSTASESLGKVRIGESLGDPDGLAHPVVNWTLQGRILSEFLLAEPRERINTLSSIDGLDGEVNWPLQTIHHRHHILSAPLAFNLLLARPYPHTHDDLRQARELCLELGLGPLLERMPAGLDQMVGETGWQLSQGERSRVFLARALLQGSDMVVLDESLAALDPENLQQCLDACCGAPEHCL